MIQKVMRHRDSLRLVSQALRVSEQTIRARMRILDGISAKAIWLLTDTSVGIGAFRYLRKMKPSRQVEVAQLMIGLDNYSLRVVQAMLKSTARKDLSDKGTEKERRAAELDRLYGLQCELFDMRAGIKLHETSYGAASLQLTVVKTYVETMLESVNVVKWLARNRPDYLQQLQAIADIDLLPGGSLSLQRQ